MNNLNIGDTVFIVKISEKPVEKGGEINPRNYNVLAVNIIGIYKEEIKVEFENGRRQRIKNGQYFMHEVEAKQYCYKLANNVWRTKCAQKIKFDPPEQLLPNFNPRFTGNPLRFAERNITFVAQSNVWGSEVNEQKIIQVIAMTFEDIEMLIGILDVLGFMNDYAKKLLGKYIIIELSSLFNLLSKLKDLNVEYKQNEYKELLVDIQHLEEKYKFKFIRDKVAAHKDSDINLKNYVEIWNAINQTSLKEYWSMFVNHIDKVLMKYYQEEKKIYFLIRQQPLNGILDIKDKGNEYIPFSDIEV
jgi:hypothetical protein